MKMLISQPGLDELQINEEVCRKHVLELRAALLPLERAFFIARHKGGAEPINQAWEKLEEARQYCAERENNFRSYSDKLIEHLNTDLACILATPGLAEFKKKNAENLASAKASRKQILGDE